jgi:hypothetical protein
MLRDAPQRTWAMKAPALGFRCDAPQHEGKGRRILAKRSQDHFGHRCRPRESGDPWSPPVVMGPGSRCARPGRRSLWSERSTNLRLCEMTAGLPSLFPACSLQGMVQPTRAGRIERSRFCKATRSHTCRWSGRHIRTGRWFISRGASPSCRPVCVGASVALSNKPRRPHSTLFLVRQPCAVRSAPTVSCDESCAAGGMPSRSL